MKHRSRARKGAVVGIFGNRSLTVAAPVALLLVSGLSAAPDFARDIRPLLSDRCFACHGPDANKRQAGLRLDTREAVFATTTSGATPVVAGDPGASALIDRVGSQDPARRMPPSYLGHDPLDEGQVELLKAWVEAGAEYSEHWAFQPPAKPEPPGDSGAPIDRFVRDRLRNDGLAPASEAPAAAWLRRAALDLTGLPPSPEHYEEFEAAVQQDGETAYEKAVDKLLASPRYGERMAIDWLDVARYADTHGFNNDSERSMWRWRDWVIESFNSNLPYDRFITEQLAGDLLPDPTLDQLIATGFNRNHVINSEGGIIDEEYRVEYVVDRVRTAGIAWMGLSIECARCHDHKFDPITQKDYYRFFAFFNTAPEWGEAGRVANAPPMISAPTVQQQREIAELADKVRALESAAQSREQAWRWKDSYSGDVEALIAAARSHDPGAAALEFACEGACATTSKVDSSAIKLGDDGSFTLSLWMEADDEEAGLATSADYSIDPASSQYGAGIDLRLAGDEIELRMSKRFPAYSVTVRSVGAQIKPGQGRQVAAAYHGADGRSFGRSRAVGVRLYADGRELDMRVIHDDLQGAARFAKTMTVGARVDELALWPRALSAEGVRSRFLMRALPTGEADWLRDALLWETGGQELAQARRALFAARRSAPSAMVMAEMAEPRPTHVLGRGMYDEPGEVVEADVPQGLLGAFPADQPKNRLGLARWLTSDTHPLTARVVVNRFWQQLFGTGLVKTSENFGYQGEPPSHPELLDWLARDFIDSGWDVKALMKSIVLSKTYRQDSAITPELLELDPENRLLARGPRFRLPAELIRDQALSLAGLLEHRLGGPSVKPYQPAGLYNTVVVGADYPGSVWENSSSADLYRRSLYTYWKRTLPHPAMTVFDAPDREFCIARRSTTNTPLQALTLMNDPTFVEASRKFAERMMREGGATPDQRIAFGFRAATGREIDSDEVAILVATFERMLAAYRSDSSSATALLEIGESPAPDDLPRPELAAYATIASMILNLDEVLNKG